MMLCGAVAPPRMHVVAHSRGEGRHGVVATYTVVTMGWRRKSTNGVWAGQVIREARDWEPCGVLGLDDQVAPERCVERPQ
jgi:hypothetical protein